ncbi:MAG: carboxypeptidase-like regulatory domain-containing protein, partial [Ilyomonas sp.]
MSAQSTAATISGTVISKTTGNPVEGATVVIKGTKRSAITNSTGHFTISAAPGETLVVSYVGYANVETKVVADNNISISLSENYGNLSDVVVVG